MDLAILVYHACQLLPSRERFELARQLRRAATSVPSNIAEGFSRHSRGAYRAHVAIALGSLAELETQVELSARLHCLPDHASGELLSRAKEVGRILEGLWRSLREKSE